MDIKNNKESHRFETEVAGGTAYLEYYQGKHHIAIIHSFVPEPSRKKGIAGEMVKYMLGYVMQENLKLFVYCPYVESYIKKNPVFLPLVSKFYTKKDVS